MLLPPPPPPAPVGVAAPSGVDRPCGVAGIDTSSGSLAAPPSAAIVIAVAGLEFLGFASEVLEWEPGLLWEAVKRKGGAGECAVGDTGTGGQ